MQCRSCPYGKEEFEEKMNYYENVVQKEDIQNNVYGYLKLKDMENEICDYLWCDKVGGKICLMGRCDDAYSDIPKSKNHFKQKRKNKRERDWKHKNYMKFLVENAQYCPVIYIDEIYVKEQGFVENTKPYYKRLYRANHKGSRYSFYKKYANRCVRRYKGEIHKNGNQFRKIFDYWWAVD